MCLLGWWEVAVWVGAERLYREKVAEIPKA